MTKLGIADLLSVCRPYDRLILSVADTLPPTADFGRVLYIRDEVEKVNGGQIKIP